MSITREQWLAVREDYIRGRGSLATLATRHGLKRGSVEKCSRREGWLAMRTKYEESQRDKLFPPPPPTLPPVPVAPDGTVSVEWLRVRYEIHYRRNFELLDKVRALLDAKLTASEKPSTDELGKLTSAMGGLATTEIALLGLNRRREKNKQRARPVPPPDPFEG